MVRRVSFDLTGLLTILLKMREEFLGLGMTEYEKESQLSTLIIPLQFYDLERRIIATDTQIEAELVLYFSTLLFTSPLG